VCNGRRHPLAARAAPDEEFEDTGRAEALRRVSVLHHARSRRDFPRAPFAAADIAGRRHSHHRLDKDGRLWRGQPIARRARSGYEIKRLPIVVVDDKMQRSA